MKAAFGVLLFLLGLFIIGIVATTEPISASPGTEAVTLNEYKQVKTGMTHGQVAKIVGGAGVESSTSQVEGYRTVLYVWQGERPASNMVAYFQNGTLISKAQVGLR